MRPPLILPKIFLLIIVSLSGMHYGTSQTPQQIVKLELAAPIYKTNTLSINNDLDIQLPVTIQGDPNNYSVSYQLNGRGVVTLTPSKKDNNNITFIIPRADYNAYNVNSITFTVRTTTPSQTYTVTVPIQAASLSKGNVLDDAIALNESTPTDTQLIIDILSYHAGQDLTYANALALIAANPYLSTLIRTNTAVAAIGTQQFDITTANNNIVGVHTLSNGQVTTTQSLTKGAGLDVAKYANAMADIMIDHAKEELTVAFFNRFDKFIKEHEEFQVLFPKTTEKLSKLLSYKYPEMIKSLREVFHEDLRLIAYKIDDVMLLPKYSALSASYPEISIAIKSLRLIHQLETDGLNAGGVLDTMANFREWNSAAGSNSLKNFGNALRVANLINQSLSIRNEGVSEWQDANKTVKLFQDDRLFTFYMGLIYVKASSAPTPIQFIPRGGGPNVTFTSVLTTQATNIAAFQNRLHEFIDLTGVLQKSISDIKKGNGKLSDVERHTYISNSIDVLQYAFSLYTFFDPSYERSDDCITILRLSNDIYKNIYEENYNAAISNSLDLFEKFSGFSAQPITFTDAQVDAVIVRIESLNGAVADAKAKSNLKDIAKKLKNPSKVEAEDINYLYDKVADAQLLTVKNNSNLKGLLKLVQKIKPYALFMANMIEAKDEKEVKAALDAVILPVGSSSIKKNSDFNFNFQSYLGARVSFTNAKKETAENTWNDRFALSAPIGLSISYGLDNNWGALSLFVPIIDLGAIVDYKLKYKNEDTPAEEVESKDYTVKLGQIFSPGVYFVYGFGANIPLSFGIGGQYGPGLSKIDEDSSTHLSNPYWKWNAFLSVDIPLFNLANKAKVK